MVKQYPVIKAQVPLSWYVKHRKVIQDLFFQSFCNHDRPPLELIIAYF